MTALETAAATDRRRSNSRSSFARKGAGADRRRAGGCVCLTACGSGSAWMSAGALPGLGTTTVVTHLGHSVLRPAARSGALTLPPQVEQTTEICIASPRCLAADRLSEFFMVLPSGQ